MIGELQIPVLETPRLVLRGWRETDLDPFARMYADPEVARFIGGTLSRNDAWRGMATMVGHWIFRGFGFWAVERKSDRVFVGRVGLWQPEGWPGVEVGWGLDRPYWGQGYATEAAAACCDYGFAHLPETKLISLIDPANAPSQKVALRLGETKGPSATITVRGEDHTADIWEMPRERWLAHRRGSSV